MGTENKSDETNRRQFIGKVLQLGCLACLSPSKLCSTLTVAEKSTEGQKFQADSKWSFEQVYKFAFQQQLIPNLTAIANEIGRDRLIEIVKKTSDDNSSRAARYNASQTNNPNLDSFIGWARKPDYFWNHAITYTTVEDSPGAFEFKVTECIWAKTLKEANAGDLGYAAICHGDFAYASNYSPKLKLIRTKTLMQGDEYCNHRYIWTE